MARVPVIVLGKQGWHQGVVGIVAGRLASRFGKPTVVIGFDGDSGRGSVRGPAGFHLYDALAKSADALRGFGGHQAAAGVHLDWHQLDAFRDRFAQACEDLGAGPSSAPVAVADAVLEEYEEPSRVLRDLDRFEPCGHRNPAPLLGLGRVRVASVRALRGGHLSLDMETGTGRLAGFGFEMGDEASRIKAAGHVQVLGKLRWDTYRGNGAVQFRVEAVEALA
jgi:single-stranded-DNA-specific exonuclease